MNMKNIKLFTSIGLLGFTGALAAFCLPKLLQQHLSNVGATNTYSLSIPALDPNNIADDVYTSNGNIVCFEHSNYSLLDDNWGILGINGYVENSTQISGIESVSVVFFDSNQPSLSVYYGWGFSSYPITNGVIDTTNNIYNFNGEKPSFFRLVNNNFTELAIKSITITYSCSESVMPVEYALQYTKYDEKDEYYVSKCFNGVQNVVVSSEYNNLPVTGIGANSFSWIDSIVSVTLPNSIQTIEEGAFAFSRSLSSVNIPDGITSINNALFNGCESLSGITLPNSITTIGSAAFRRCYSLTAINIPNNVVSIGNFAFSNCPFSTLELPDGLETIGIQAFMNCSSLQAINIPKNVKSIGDYAFTNCTSLVNISLPSSLISLGEGAFMGCTSLSTINISSHLSSINPYAFYECRFSSITLPNTLISIGEQSFGLCVYLLSITIPESVSEIGYRAFYGCWRLDDFNYEGTIAQWNTITKESNWNELISATTVHCSNGDVTI